MNVRLNWPGATCRSFAAFISPPQLSLMKILPEYFLNSTHCAACPSTESTVAPSCMPHTKYCAGIIASTVMALLCLNWAFREHLHKRKLLLLHMKPHRVSIELHGGIFNLCCCDLFTLGSSCMYLFRAVTDKGRVNYRETECFGLWVIAVYWSPSQQKSDMKSMLRVQPNQRCHDDCGEDSERQIFFSFFF